MDCCFFLMKITLYTGNGCIDLCMIQPVFLEDLLRTRHRQQSKWRKPHPCPGASFSPLPLKVRKLKPSHWHVGPLPMSHRSGSLAGSARRLPSPPEDAKGGHREDVLASRVTFSCKEKLCYHLFGSTVRIGSTQKY